MKKENNKKSIFPMTIENLFLIVGLVFGTLFVFVNAPFHSNDEDLHFYRAYSTACGDFLPIQQAEETGNKVGQVYPKNLVEVTRSYQGLPFAKGYRISVKDKLNPSRQVALNPQDTTFHMFPYKHISCIPYIPATMGILFGKTIESNPVWLMWFARFFGMLAFIIIVYFAIKTTPIFKPVFFLTALTPMTLFQACSITYDTLSTATTFLLIAIFLKFAFDKDAKIKTKDLIAIIIIALIHRYSKDGYFLIPFLFFMIPMEKIGSPAKAIGMGVFFILLYFIPEWTWQSIANSLNFRPGGQKPMQNDFRFDRNLNLDYNLSNPGQFFHNIWINIMYWKEDWLVGAFGKLGYSYTKLPTGLLVLHGLVLIFAAFISGERDIKVKLSQKALIFGVLFISFMMIIVGFYVGGSPIGAVKIFGMQGRYFIPFLPLIFLLLYNNVFVPEKWEKWSGYAVAAYLIIILTYCVVFMKDAFYAA